MGELSDRRARKKARTRAEILRSAQELFAERGFDAVTIADIASAADVAVQTVFNHFATKEELFFADRTPWVDGPADAVRTRPDGVAPLAALRAYAMRAVVGFVQDNTSEDRRGFVRLILASPALCAFELELVHRAEQRLAEALAEAWSEQPPGSAGSPGTTTAERPCLEVRVAASLTAALWISAASSLSLELRGVHDDDADSARIPAVVETLADRLFTRLEGSLATLLQLPEQAGDADAATPGRPQAPPTERRAG